MQIQYVMSEEELRVLINRALFTGLSMQGKFSLVEMSTNVGVLRWQQLRDEARKELLATLIKKE